MQNFLDESVRLLREKNLLLINSSDDGRVNSINNEDQIIKLLKDHFGNFLEIPSIRQWYDIAFIHGSTKIFINIKVSDFKNNAADNLSSKLGMGYALTGLDHMPISWDEFNNMLADNLRTGYDYYFLVIDKNCSTNVFWTSLKRIQYLQPNGSNLPFQCNWARNTIPSTRTEVESMRYILEIYLQSWNKKTKGYPHKIRDILENDKLIDE